MHFDVTVHARFGVNTLRLHSYMQLVSHTPRLIENGVSLPASKRVSGTQTRVWIEGVWVPRSLQQRRLGPVLLEFSQWLYLTLYLTFSGYTTKAHSLIAVYSCVIKHTQMTYVLQLTAVIRLY